MAVDTPGVDTSEVAAKPVEIAAPDTALKTIFPADSIWINPNIFVWTLCVTSYQPEVFKIPSIIVNLRSVELLELCAIAGAAKLTV
jgi:hypothetical protein